MVQVVLSSPGVQDLGDVTCAFGESRVAAQVVNSTLLSCIAPMVAPDLETGHPPPLIDGVPPDAIRTVTTEVSMDGIHFTTSGMQFTYFDLDRMGAIASLAPIGGPRHGGTPVRLQVRPSSLMDFGGTLDSSTMDGVIACKFGSYRTM